MRKFIAYSFIAIGFLLLASNTSQSQIIAGEDNCDTQVFTGTVTYPNGEPDPFEWECHGEFTDCTEVYITCPKGPQQ